MDNISEKVTIRLEEDYVKATYDSIAEEFSGTRYKKWPKVEEFLQSIPKGSILLDVGCGNGKYLDNNGTINIGCDISLNLLTICKTRGFEVAYCDMMKLPYKERSFDTIICIAALHHISSAKRRQKCIESMIDLMSDENSRLFIQVWSYEQELKLDNPYLSQARIKSLSGKGAELEIDSIKLPIHVNRTPFRNQDLLVPFKVKQKVSNDNSEIIQDQQHFRYYHVFKQGELEDMINKVPQAEIVDSFYDKGNWCSIIKRKSKYG